MDLMNFGIILIGFLLAAAVGGFVLLKASEEYKTGVEKKSKPHIWSAFFMITFLYIILTFVIVRGSV